MKGKLKVLFFALLVVLAFSGTKNNVKAEEFDTERSEEIEANFTLNYDELVLFAGEKVDLEVSSALFENKTPLTYEEWLEYSQYSGFDHTGDRDKTQEDEKYYFNVEFFSMDERLIVDSEGLITAPVDTENLYTQIYVHITYYDVNNELEGYLYCDVMVSNLEITGDEIVATSLTKSYTASVVYTLGELSWSVSDEKIATVSEDGIVTGKSFGTVDVIATITDGDSNYAVSKTIRVSDPKINVLKDAVAVGGTYEIPISGIYDDSVKSFTSSKKTYASVDNDGKVYGLKKRTAAITITAIIDGKTITTKVCVTNPTLKYGVNSPILLVKGKSTTIKLKGLSPNYSDVSFRSGRTTIAKVTKKGKVKGKKWGSCYIYVTVDYKTFKLNCAVGKKKAIKAVKRAYKAVGGKYSQLYRMSEGCYDCSSLVYRSFSPYGCKFGATNSWAPVAAEEYRYLVNTGKSIAKKKVSYKKLRPGDVIFYSGWKNGRYRNITHVAIYVANQTTIEASDYDIPIGEGTYKKQSKIVGIGRPY